MDQIVMWEHPILGIGKYFSKHATPQDAAEECADIFAGQPVKISVWNAIMSGPFPMVENPNGPDYEINNG